MAVDNVNQQMLDYANKAAQTALTQMKCSKIISDAQSLSQLAQGADQAKTNSAQGQRSAMADGARAR